MNRIVLLVILLLVLIGVGVAVYMMTRKKSCVNVDDANAKEWNTDCTIKSCASGYTLTNGNCVSSNTGTCTNVSDPNAMNWNTDCSIKDCKDNYILTGGSCALDTSKCMLTTKTYDQGARCSGPNGVGGGERHDAGWCCSPAGVAMGYKWAA